jgi:uncharacterized protein YgbK (DUF1537 family)
VFGNLFAADRAGIHRIDRHPSMRAHPITPMDEGDLRVHLARQTSLCIAGMNLPELRRDSLRWPEEADVLMFDGLDPGDSARSARWIWEHRTKPQTFVVGSSGFTYGLIDYWRALGLLPDSGALSSTGLRNQGRLLVLAGSCSPATATQIRHALRSGFHGIRLDAAGLGSGAAERDAVTQLAAGRSVILYSALGDADRVEIDDGTALAAAMGRLLRNVIRSSGVSRVVVAGGDTSSHAARDLGISALTFSAPLTRGAPLCRAHGGPSELELVLKGGQIGPADFFEQVMRYGEAA